MPVRSRPDPDAIYPKPPVYVGAEVLDIPEPDWLLDDFIQEGGLTIVHGPPGAGKSLLVQDWSMVVANGWEWGGRETKQGTVLYLMGEGQGGLRGRILAWLQHRATEGVPPVHWIMGVIPLWRTPGTDFTAEQHGILEYIENHGVRLFVVDTLAAAFGGGNENMQQDMNQFVGFLSAAQKLGTAVVVVHHESKRDQTMRGSSVLLGSADTVVKLAPEFDANDRLALVEIRCKKQKDGTPFSRFQMKPEQYEVDTYRGESVALRYAEKRQMLKEEREIEMLAFIQTNQGCSFNDVAKALKGRRAQLSEVRDDLLERGILEYGDDGKRLYAVTPEQEDEL